MDPKNKKIGRRAGGADNPSENVIDNDYYFDGETADFIFDYLSPHFSNYPEYPRGVNILDLCSGESCVLGISINNILQNSKKKISDKPLSSLMFNNTTFVDKKFGNDLFTFQYKNEYNLIVSNPPWIPVDLAFNIYKKCLQILAPGGVLFFVINNTFIYQGPNRWIGLKGQKYYLLPRYIFDNAINRKIRIKNIKARDDLDDKTKAIKCSQPILLDAGVLVYHADNIIPKDAVNLSPIIPVPVPVNDPTPRFAFISILYPAKKISSKIGNLDNNCPLPSWT